MAPLAPEGLRKHGFPHGFARLCLRMVWKKQCATHVHDHCQRCAESCRRCAEACRQVAA
jgi:HD superfamily phosphodiesterase